jgi:hypothetical protein
MPIEIDFVLRINSNLKLSACFWFYGKKQFILVKTELNVNWFMFWYIYVSWTINSSVKIMFRLKNYKS